MKIPVNIDDDLLRAIVDQGTVQAMQQAISEAILKDPAFDFIIEQAVKSALDDVKDPGGKINSAVVARSIERVVMFAAQDVAAAKSGIIRRYSAAIAGRTSRLILEQLEYMEGEDQ